MKKVFKVADLRKLEKQVLQGEISYSKKVEILNEMANNAFSEETKKDEKQFDGLKDAITKDFQHGAD